MAESDNILTKLQDLLVYSMKTQFTLSPGCLVARMFLWLVVVSGWVVPVAHAATSFADSNITTVDTRGVSITSPPQSQTVAAAANVTFTVAVAGVPSFNYQWYFNGQNIAGQTATSLSLTNVQFANAGGYSVVVTNIYGAVTSAVAQLTVFTNLVLVQTNRTPTIKEIGSATIPTDPTHFKVYTNGMFQSGIGINPNKITVVMTHGWNGSPSDWAEYTAQIIQRRIGANAVNIVAWDWSAEAASSTFKLGEIAAKTPGQGKALGANLITALGTNYTKRIHFVGHSLGTLVNGAAAEYVHTHGFSWANTQMTLCDEAEAAWELTSTGWQMATTLPQTIEQAEVISGQVKKSIITLAGNFSTPQPSWNHPLPNQFAWADNYISACGLLHPEAANVILTWGYPTSIPDFETLGLRFLNFHSYGHYFYEDTIEPGIFNTGGQSNATYMGFICSFEGGGTAGRPATNTYFYQDSTGFELTLVPTDIGSATNFLNARFANYLVVGVASTGWAAQNWVFNGIGNAVLNAHGYVVGKLESTAGMIFNLLTGSGSTPLIQNLNVKPMGGPVPNGLTGTNTPAYAWIPLTVPSNAVSMSFNFLLQGNGNEDSFQVALGGTNILSLETSLIQTNVTLSSGLINVSSYAGQQVELFLGIVGGTSTNAALTVSDFQFYVTLPPALQIQLSGTNVVLTWPLSATGYVLEKTDKLTPTNLWATVTNVPAIVDFQYTITNQISGAARFYRLSE